MARKPMTVPERKALKDLLDIVETFDDAGPKGEGWQSSTLENSRKVLQGYIDRTERAGPPLRR